MKRFILFSGVLGLAATLSAQSDGFTLTGDFPGLKQGSKVELVSMEGGSLRDLGETVAADGSFVLKGSVEAPTMSQIRITSPEKKGECYAISLMVENVPIEVSAAHIDSVPPSFYFGTAGLLKEKNVTVKGGEGQREYAEYEEALFPYKLAAKAAHYDFYIDENRDKSPETEKRLEAAYDRAGMELDSIQDWFMREHPSYSVSGYLLTRKLYEPFRFTAGEVDGLVARSEGMRDAKRFESVKKGADFARRFSRNSRYTDFVALDTLGVERRISEFATGGKYLFIDFWASWCGPCRASIPHVRDMYRKYGDRVNVVSVSVDSADKPWRKAMAEEAMEWTQLWAGKDYSAPLADHYQLSSIPFMLVVNPSGEIIYAGHDPAEVDRCLADRLGE